MMTEGAEDLFRNLPVVILQRILCFVPIELAIKTSLLSKRWRHVWREIPSLSLKANTLTADSINKTLARYTAPKMKSFHLLNITNHKEHTIHRHVDQVRHVTQR